MEILGLKSTIAKIKINWMDLWEQGRQAEKRGQWARRQINGSYPNWKAKSKKIGDRGNKTVKTETLSSSLTYV